MSVQRLARIAVGAAVLMALLSACGGSSKKQAAAITTVPATTSTVATTSTTTVGDQAKAMTELLLLTDLPAGWTSTPDSDASDNGGLGNDGEAQLAACLGVSASRLDANPPEADSPEFTSANQAETVDDEVEVFPTAAAAASDFSIFDLPETPHCLSQLFNGPFKSDITSGLEAGQTLVSLTAASRSFPAIGMHSADVEITFVIRQSGVDIKVSVDLIVVTQGRSETQLTLTAPQTASLPQLGPDLARVAVSRMS